MSGGPVHDGLGIARAVMRERCKAFGLPTLRCDLDGGVLRDDTDAAASFGQLVDAWAASPRVGALLRAAGERWAEQGEPGAALLFPFCWAAPLAETHRRKRSGYIVALALGTGALETEEFAESCRSAGLDAPAVREALGPFAVYDEISVARAMRGLTWMHRDRLELVTGEEALCGFSRQLTEAYEELSLLYKLGHSMNEVVHPGKFVRLLCDELHATLSFRWIAARFVRDARAARHLAGRCVVSGDARCAEEALSVFIDAALDSLAVAGPMVLSPGDLDQFWPPSVSSAVLIQPIMRDGRLIGALVAGEKQGADTVISGGDMKLLDAAAQHLTILLENAALYDDQQSMFLGTLEALTASIDAKDRYTCGHSERVAHLAMRLAGAIGLEETVVERVRICGLVHDVGKIGVPESVLSKPGRLTEEEFELVKAHPGIGHRILKDIPQLADVLPGVLHHHERWDGRGYPHGLAGAKIPLFARLVGLADSFDAMSSTRTYRAAMPREQVLAEIRKCAGAQFDPDLAPRFVGLDFHEYDAMVARHVERERKTFMKGRAA